MDAQDRQAGARSVLLRSFSSLDDATAAQDALAAAGVPRELMELSVRQDEAGPAAGNFLIGNGVTTHGGPPQAVRTGPEVPYDENFRDAEYRGGYLLVMRLDAAQRALAESVLARFDAVPADEVADAGTPRP